MKITFFTTFLTLLILFASCHSSNEEDTKTTEDHLLAVTTAATNNPEVYYYVTAPSGLSLRAGSNLNSDKVLTLPYGAEVKFVNSPEHTAMTVEGIQGKMIEINYQGATGFAFDGFLTTLAPPQKNESINAYAKRISTANKPVEVIKTPSKSGEAYGMTTSIDLPAKSWLEAYRISQQLLNLPKSIYPDLSKTSKAQTLINKNKRSRTEVDELTVIRDTDGLIQRLKYTYKMRDYSREVRIEKSETGFLITEIESSL